MKKLFILLLAMVLTVTLTGCGNDSNGKDADNDKNAVTKTCTLDDGQGSVQTWKYSATNEKINKVEITMLFDNAMLGIENFDKLDATEKEQVKKGMLKNLGLDNLNYEGLEASISIEKQTKVVLVANLDKADPEVLLKVGIDAEELKNLTIDEVADKQIIDTGAVCK